MSRDEKSPESYNHKFAVVEGGYKYHYIDQGNPEGEPILLVHGFPDIWYGWRFQIDYLVEKGFRVIVPDCLGYGQTDSPICDPEHLEPYALKTLSAQLASLLDILNIPKVTIIGHDWGGALVWRMGLHQPHRVKAIVSICTPFFPVTDEYESLEKFAEKFPDFQYMLRLALPETTEKMNANKEKIFKDLQGKGLISDKAIEYMIEEFGRNGFHGPLNYYRTRKINWEHELTLTDRKLHQPSLMIATARDEVLKPIFSERMGANFDQLKRVIIDAAHFAMTERPDEVNHEIGLFLDELRGKQIIANASL